MLSDIDSLCFSEALEDVFLEFDIGNLLCSRNNNTIYLIKSAKFEIKYEYSYIVCINILSTENSLLFRRISNVEKITFMCLQR